MASKLLQARRTNLISPLIDVVLGAFLALFVLFSAFVITGGEHTETLRFLPEAALPPAIEGQSYVFTFPVTGGGQREFELDGELPGELTFETGTGTIYGFVQPSPGRTVRDFLFTVTVRGSGSDTREATLRVLPGAIPYDPEDGRFRLVEPAGQLPTGRIGRSYSAVFGALGGVEPYRWSSDGFPRGLGLEGGLLSGVPAEAGSFAGTVRVVHSLGRFRYRNALYEWAGGSASASFQLQVYGPLRLAERFPTGRVSEPYLGALVANGLLPDEKVEWRGLPPGLAVSESGLLLLGVPTEAGTFSADYRVRTPDEELVAGNVEIVILPAMEPPALGPATLQFWLEEPGRHLLPVKGLCGPLRLSVEGELPPGLELRDGYLTGTTSQAGLTTVQITATDDTGRSVTGSITIRVGPRY